MNYSDLKTAIADYLDRDDLTSRIDTFIDVAEAMHAREIRIREMIQRSQASASDRFLALPTGFLEMRTLRLLTSPVTTLTELALSDMNRLRSDATGKPQAFTVHAEIEFDRSPDQAYTAEMIYVAKMTPLSNENPTNALLDRSLDAYLYAALSASAPFLMHDERMEVWHSLYALARDALNTVDRRRAGPLVSRISGPTP